jgi:hypothetical protein
MHCTQNGCGPSIVHPSPSSLISAGDPQKGHGFNSEFGFEHGAACHFFCCSVTDLISDVSLSASAWWSAYLLFRIVISSRAALSSLHPAASVFNAAWVSNPPVVDPSSANLKASANGKLSRSISDSFMVVVSVLGVCVEHSNGDDRDKDTRGDYAEGEFHAFVVMSINRPSAYTTPAWKECQNRPRTIPRNRSGQTSNRAMNLSSGFMRSRRRFGCRSGRRIARR